MIILCGEAVRGQVYNVSSQDRVWIRFGLTCSGLPPCLAQLVCSLSFFWSQEYVTFDGMAKVCAEAAGISDPQIVHYDPKSVEVPTGAWWGGFETIISTRPRSLILYIGGEHHNDPYCFIVYEAELDHGHWSGLRVEFSIVWVISRIAVGIIEAFHCVIGDRWHMVTQNGRRCPKAFQKPFLSVGCTSSPPLRRPQKNCHSDLGILGLVSWQCIDIHIYIYIDIVMSMA